jgi:XRE family transcriptional regulator, fatty acid utilization regulator
MTDKIVNKVLFGKKIKQARENIGLTQFALADNVGVSQNFLGDIERGIKLPSIETLIKLSNVLKVSLDSLFSASLDNIISEEEDIIYTDKQMKILTNVIKTINNNF